MKKLLLIVMAIGFISTSMAQNKITKTNTHILRELDNSEVYKPQNLPAPVLNTKVTNEDVDRIYIGMSANQRCLRRSEAKVITYHPDLDAISATFTLDPTTYNEVTEGGIIGQVYSLDHGQTWSNPVVLANDLSEGTNYYLSGAIYNPAGNTNINDAFGFAQGVIYPLSDSWRFKSYGTSTLDGNSQTNYIFEETDADYPYNGYWNIFGLSQVGNEMRMLNMMPTGDWGNFETCELQPIVAELNGTGFDFDFSTIIDANLYLPDNQMAWIGNWQGNDAGIEIAWSDDGEIGYMWVVGVSDDELSGYQPIIFITEDGGDSWDEISLDFLTDEMQTSFAPFLIENWVGDIIPYFFETSGVVNANGELELFSAVRSHSADVFNNPDSLNWSWTVPGDLFNLTIDDNGILDFNWVYSLLTKNVLESDDNCYANNGGWQHRLHASRNITGTQVFVIWGDTETPDAEFNINPDLFGWSKSICGDIEGPINFTEGTLYEGFYYFNSSADLVYENNDGGFTVPTLQGVTPSEFVSNGSTSSDPITMNYVTGIEFTNFGCETEESIVSINPTTQTVNTNETFTTTVEIEEVTNLGSFELNLDFDPSYLQANSVTIGSFLGSTGRQIFPLTNTIDNNNGFIEYAVTTLGATPPGPDGNGTLLTVEWTSAASVADEITTNILIQDLQITEPNGTVLDVSSQDGSITISPCYYHDFDCDCDVDIVDVTMAAYAYGTVVGDANYDPTFDLDNDGDIDIVDITMVTYDYGWTCSKSTSALINLDNVSNEDVTFGLSSAVDNNDGTYNVELLVKNIEQLGGYELELGFDANFMEVLSIEDGEFISSTNRELLPISSVIDNESGNVQFTVTSLGSQINGASGDGVLITIKCKSLNMEDISLEFIHAQLVRIDARVINYSFKSNELKINATSIISTYPSPFKDHMSIQYNVEQAGKIAFKFYNVYGGLLKTTEAVDMKAGNYTKAFNNLGLNAGMYIVSLEQNGVIVDKKKIIVD